MPTAVWHSLSLCRHCPSSLYPDGLLSRTSTRPYVSEPSRPGTWHARSCLRSEQPASQNAFRRIVCPNIPKNIRVKIEVSLRWVYSLLRALFVSLGSPITSTLEMIFA
jgi:hypothetical protein